MAVYLFRNKEEGYFIASELLRKICSNHRGVEAMRKFPALVRRLHSLVEELMRKADIEKRFVLVSQKLTISLNQITGLPEQIVFLTAVSSY